jgi:hypothetical protein
MLALLREMLELPLRHALVCAVVVLVLLWLCSRVANLSKEVLLPVVKNLAKLCHAVLNVLLRCCSQCFDMLCFFSAMTCFTSVAML